MKAVVFLFCLGFGTCWAQNTARIHYERGEAYMETSQYDLTAQEYELALRSEPLNPTIQERLSEAREYGLFMNPKMSQTVDALNGRMWKAMTSRDRNLYVRGIINALLFAAPKELRWPEGLTWSEGETMMNDLYSRPENVSIPIVFVMQAITLKVGGATQAEYEDFLSASRRIGKRASLEEPAGGSTGSGSLEAVSEK
jgi:hypothetical protein